MVICEKTEEEKFAEDIKLEETIRKERGRRIRRIRECQLKKSKKDFGELIGVTGQFVGMAEEGKANFNYRNLRKISTLTGYSADYILFGKKDGIFGNGKLCDKRFAKDEIEITLRILREISELLEDE